MWLNRGYFDEAANIKKRMRVQVGTAGGETFKSKRAVLDKRQRLAMEELEPHDG